MRKPGHISCGNGVITSQLLVQLQWEACRSLGTKPMGTQMGTRMETRAHMESCLQLMSTWREKEISHCFVRDKYPHALSFTECLNVLEKVVLVS